MAEATEVAAATVQDLQTLAAQMRDMRDTICAQQETIACQQEQLARLEAALGPQDHPRRTPIVDVEANGRPARAPRQSGRRIGRPDRTGASSRRALLKGAGVAAAAATVALVASEEQRAHAAGATDNSALIVSQDNTTTYTTNLIVTGGAVPMTFVVDASASTYTPVPTGIGPIAVVGGVISNSLATSIGVYGTAGAGTGVYGTNSGGGVGVQGINTGSGIGLVGQSSANVDFAAFGTGRIYQNHQGVAGAPTGSGTSYSIGEQIRDSNGDLWLCTESGSPGQWVMAAHAVYGYSGGATTYIAHPIRLLDTRGNDTLAQNDNGGNPIASGSPYTLTIANVNWQSVQVPANAVGAIGNVTVVADKGSGGYVAVVPSGAGFTGTANLAYSAGQVVSNSFNVGLAGGKLDIIIGSGSADVIVDLFAVVA